MKINKELIKQILLIMTGILLIFVGYFNYNLDIKNNETVEVAKQDVNEINLGDVQLVNSEPDDIYKSAIVSNDEIQKINNNVNDNKVIESLDNIKQENIILDNTTINDEYDYFQETRIERENMYSEMIETYQKLIENQETPSDQKAIAAQEISNITNIKNGIMISENLIKNKGFNDVIILVNNGTVSVVVKAYSLNQEQISKIQNIIESKLSVETQNITITNRF